MSRGPAGYVWVVARFKEARYHKILPTSYWQPVQVCNFFQVTINPDLGMFGSITVNDYQVVLIISKAHAYISLH